MTTKPDLTYTPGMSFDDFQKMIAERGQRSAPRTRPVSLTEQTPGPDAGRKALRERLTQVQAELRRTAARLATAKRRIDALADDNRALRAVQAPTACTHPFSPDAIKQTAGRDSRGIVLKVVFTCPECGEQFAAPRKLIRG